MIVAVIAFGACGRSAAPAQRNPSTSTTFAGRSLAYGFDAQPTGPVTAPFSVLAGEWILRAEPGAPSQPDALCHVESDTAAALILAPSPPIADSTDSVSLKPAVAGSAGLVFRVQDAHNFYRVSGDAGSGEVSVVVERNGQTTVLARSAAPLRPGEWQELSAQMRGTELLAFVNGRRVAEASDASFTQGGIGLWAAPGVAACFDNLMATGL